ncbi:translation elongation factor Ts [soil metagenome]
MSTISAAAVNELRKKTDQPLMECKKALTEAAGDMEKATELLRSWNAKAGVKREANETAEGRVGIVIQGDKAAIVELRCESAPTAKNELFGKLVNDLAKFVLDKSPADVAALTAAQADRINEVVGVIREKMVPHRFTRLSGGVFGQYIHHDGTVGVLIQCQGKGAADEALRDICAHVAALNPQFTHPTDVPAATIEKEKAFILSQIIEKEKADEEKAVAEGKKFNAKNAQILEKIADGKLKTWMAETVLLEQPMANAGKYPNTTVGALLTKHGLTADKVVRYKVGAVSN